MAKEKIQVMVEGGKATAAPPIGPSLAPLKVNVQAVVNMINEKTKDMAGMQVPVKIIVDKDTKEFEIEVGTPPVSALIKKELKLEKGAKEPGLSRIGDLTVEQAKRIARTKFGNDGKPAVSQVEGTARSMGISVGKGEVTEEEKKRYEDLVRQREEAAAAKEAAHAAAATGTAAPAAGAEKAVAAPAAKPAEEKKAKKE